MASSDPLSASGGQGAAPVATGAPPDAVEGAGKLVPRHLLVPFILLLLCFTAWGAATSLIEGCGMMSPPATTLTRPSSRG